MKALFYTNEYPPNTYGGAGVHVEYLTRELAKIMKVDVRCFGDQRVMEEAITARGYTLNDALLAPAEKLLQPALDAFDRGLRFTADPVDADVVHCHTWYAHFGGILTKILYGIPLVITTHSLEPLRPWKREQLGRGYDLSSWVEKTALEMADAVVAVSKETKVDVLKYFDVKPEKIEVIPNGIDTGEYTKVTTGDALQTYGIDPTAPFVLFVGRITRQKGIIHLVNAIRHIDKRAQVVLCAGAPDTKEIAAEMEAKVADARKGRDNIIWIQKMVDKKTVIELYSRAAVFCCPSIYEPFGIINLEAMATETPVVASAVGGIKEVVVEGETGFLVPLEQQTESPFEALHPDKFARDLADRINRLIADPALGVRMGKKGRERAVGVYSWTAVARQVEALYRKLIRR